MTYFIQQYSLTVTGLAKTEGMIGVKNHNTEGLHFP